MIKPGGKPVTAEPGLIPRLPLITLELVLVIAEPARTAKLSAVPRFTEVAARTTRFDVVVANTRLAIPRVNAAASTALEFLLNFLMMFFINDYALG